MTTALAMGRACGECQKNRAGQGEPDMGRRRSENEA
jgi:hypothetical protein